MRLFLSSYRFGSDPTRLLEVTRGPGRVAVIANAGDAWPSRARESSVTSEFGPLRGLGYDPEEVDLRDHLGDPGSLRARLGAFSSVWVRGGNTFVLRAQLARSGGDTVLTDLVGTGALAYAGYSAGACIATPTLRGLEFSDDPAEVVEIGAGPVVWDGLGWSITRSFPMRETPCWVTTVSTAHWNTFAASPSRSWRCATTTRW